MPNPIRTNPLAGLLTGTGVIGTASAAMSVVLLFAGVQAVTPPTETPAAPAVAAPASAAWTETPATTVLTAALENPPAGWVKDGETQRSATPPFPYSCPLPGIAASTALSRAYTVNGVHLQVTELAYTAGLGAEAAALQKNNTRVCAADAKVTGGSATGMLPGQDPRLVTTDLSGAQAAVASWRRGDVITAVTAPPGAPLPALAGAFDKALTGRLGPACANLDSTLQDGSRSPYSTAGYAAFTKDTKVSIPDVVLPTAAADPAVAQSRPDTTPGPDLVPVKANPHPLPDYPVYPDMPKHVEAPTLPDAPAAKPTLEATVKVPAEERTGPGCGWSFTGMRPVPFDAAAADQTATRLTADAATKLQADAGTWQHDVLAYWSAYATYRKAADDYNAYKAKVEAVNKAWDTIAAQWDDYHQAMDDYRAKQADRADFLTRQKAAQAQFDKQTATCQAPVASPTATPTPSPLATATSSPTATTSRAPSPSSSCPAQRPAILDQQAPGEPKEPARPADPHPKG